MLSAEFIVAIEVSGVCSCLCAGCYNDAFSRTMYPNWPLCVQRHLRKPEPRLLSSAVATGSSSTITAVSPVWRSTVSSNSYQHLQNSHPRMHIRLSPFTQTPRATSTARSGLLPSPSRAHRAKSQGGAILTWESWQTLRGVLR